MTRQRSGPAPVACFPHRQEPNPLDYLAWHSRAAEATRRGERQRQCPGCKLWFFPWEEEVCET